MTLEGMFAATEPVESVADFVRSNLRDAERAFYLHTVPGGQRLAGPGGATRTLRDAGLAPSAVVHMAWESAVAESGAPVLSDAALGDLVRP